jgi:hypothetical protein
MIKEFKTTNGNFCFVKLPDNVDKKHVWITDYRPDCLEFYCKNDVCYDRIRFEHPIEIIGFVEDLENNDWVKIVDSYADCNLFDFMNYITNEGCSALESGNSLMESLDVYTENPYWCDNSYKNCNEDCLETCCTCDLIEKWESFDESKIGNWILIKYIL